MTAITKWKEKESTKNWVMKISKSGEMRSHLSGPDLSKVFSKLNFVELLGNIGKLVCLWD